MAEAITEVIEVPQGPACDADGDGDVDRQDIQTAQAHLGQPTGLGFPDSNGNGTYDIFDLRACVLQCTLPGCQEP